MSWCVSPWIFPVRDSLCLLNLIDYFLFHVGEIFNYNLFKNFLIPFLFLFFFWDPYYSNVGAFDIVPEVSETILVEELEGFEQILKMYFLHSWRRLEAGTSITKGYERSPSAWGCEWITKGYTPGHEAFEGLLLTTCFWEQGLLFHDKTPFRVSPKLCYVLGDGNCILCLNTLMFIWNGYVQVCLMLYSLRIIKLRS